MQRVVFDCPVCGYDQLTNPPKDYMICPCCGTEFGNDDFEVSHEQLRRQWLEAGAPWFSDSTAQPVEWNPGTQLLKAGLTKPRFLSASTSSQIPNVHSANQPEYTNNRIVVHRRAA
jgi:hypothetical protein